MSLSTSSSRRIYLKIILAIILGMSASLLLVRLFALANNASSDTILSRVNQARQAMPKILSEPHDLVFMYGSSMVEAGFSPRQFDREVNAQGANIKSFNFGFGGLNPLFQDMLSKRIKEDFEQHDRRLKLAMIEFNPFQTTESRYNGAVSVIDSFTSILGSHEEIMAIAKDDPKRGVLLFNIRYLRDNISAQMVTSFFGRALMPAVPRSPLKEDEELRKRGRELWEEAGKRFKQDYPDYDGSDWYYPWQGGGTIPEERSQETLELILEAQAANMTRYHLENDKLNRIHCCDIEGLVFKEELIESFIRMVKNFQTFSDKVEIMMLPRNQEWIQYSEETQARLRDVIRRIEKETQLTLVDYQTTPEITPQMFRDTTHLGRYKGDVPFTNILIRDFSKHLVQ